MNTETYAYFVVVGSGDHNKITEIIGVEPSKAFTEGTPIPNRDSFYKATKWCLYSTIDRNCPLHECMEAHVENVVSQVEAVQDRIELLGSEYEMYLQCVAYYEGSNLGLSFSSNLLRRIAALNLEIDFDLYSLPDE